MPNLSSLYAGCANVLEGGVSCDVSLSSDDKVLLLRPQETDDSIVNPSDHETPPSSLSDTWIGKLLIMLASSSGLLLVRVLPVAERY